MIAQTRFRNSRLSQQDLSPRGSMPLDFPTDLLEDVLLFDQTTAIAPVPLFSPVTSDLFEVSAYVVCTVAGAGLLDIILNWDDGYVVHNDVFGAGVNLNLVGNYGAAEKIIRAFRDTLVTYEISIAGLGGGAEYSLFLKATKI